MLLENAVLHGIQPNPEGGTIDVQATIDAQQQLCLRISNPVTTTALKTSHTGTTHTGTGTAINDLRRRLQLLFARPVRLQTSISNGRFEVVLYLPPQRNPQALP